MYEKNYFTLHHEKCDEAHYVQIFSWKLEDVKGIILHARSSYTPANTVDVIKIDMFYPNKCFK